MRRYTFCSSSRGARTNLVYDFRVLSLEGIATTSWYSPLLSNAQLHSLLGAALTNTPIGTWSAPKESGRARALRGIDIDLISAFSMALEERELVSGLRASGA